MAHNLNREMQMIAADSDRKTTEKRAPLWIFEKIDTIRKNLIQRAGKLTKPKGKLTLTLNNNEAVKDGLMYYLDALTA